MKTSSGTIDLRLLEQAVSATRSALIISDYQQPDGPIVYANPAFFELTGYDADEVIGRNCRFLQGEGTDEATIDVLRTAIKHGEETRVSIKNYKKNGDMFWNDLLLSPVKDTAGNVTHYIGTQLDLSERILYETELKQNHILEQRAHLLKQEHAQLQMLNRAKDDFISLASHQLRTPATGVKQYIGLLLEGFLGDMTPEQRHCLQQANDSNERQLRTVSDLLQIAHLDSGRTTLSIAPANLVDSLTEIIDEQNRQFEQRHQTVTFTKTRKDITWPVDEPRLRMALENIIDNASKYTPDHKKIDVKISSVPGESVTVVIADQGVGIEAGDIPKVFDKFARVTNPLSEDVGGSGLGLYWAKSIIDLHGGSITVSSKIGKGTTFTIYLAKTEA